MEEGGIMCLRRGVNHGTWVQTIHTPVTEGFASYHWRSCLIQLRWESESGKSIDPTQMRKWCQEEVQVWEAASRFCTSLICKPPPSHTTGVWYSILSRRRKVYLLSSALTVSRPTLTCTQALGNSYKIVFTFFTLIIAVNIQVRRNWKCEWRRKRHMASIFSPSAPPSGFHKKTLSWS